MSYRAVDCNLGVILYRSKTVGSGEIKNGVLGDLGTCVGILVSYGNGNALVTVGEYYCVLTFGSINNCGAVNVVVGKCNNRVVRVVTINYNALKRDLVA